MACRSNCPPFRRCVTLSADALPYRSHSANLLPFARKHPFRVNRSADSAGQLGPPARQCYGRHCYAEFTAEAVGRDIPVFSSSQQLYRLRRVNLPGSDIADRARRRQCADRHAGRTEAKLLPPYRAYVQSALTGALPGRASSRCN